MYQFLRRILTPIFYLLFPIRLKGKEHFPGEGAFILAANHGSLIDPVGLAIALKKREIHFMAKKELFSTAITKWLFETLGCIPIDRGKNDLSGLRKSLQVLKEGEILGMFPEGTRVRDEDSTAAKTGVAMLSAKSGLPILPVSIRSTYKWFSPFEVEVHPLYYLEKKERYTSADYASIGQDIMRTIKNKKS